MVDYFYVLCIEYRPMSLKSSIVFMLQD